MKDEVVSETLNESNVADEVKPFAGGEDNTTQNTEKKEEQVQETSQSQAVAQEQPTMVQQPVSQSPELNYVDKLIDKKIQNMQSGENVFGVGRVTKVKDFILEVVGITGAAFYEKINIANKAIGYVTKLEITNLPSLADLDANYIECEQTMANFASIYKYTTGSGSDITTVNPLKFTPSNYNDQSLEIVKTIPGAAANDPSTYSINGETATSNPLYILDGGVSLNDKAAGSTDIKGYIDQKFQYFVAPNMPTVATGDLHDLKIDYYIEYLDNKAEKFSRTVRLDDNTFNFDEMLASYIYNINITISLDQIYITVDDVLWNSGPSTPADINISGDEL